MRKFNPLAILVLAAVAAGCGDQNLTSPAALGLVGPQYAVAPAGSLIYIVAGNGQVGQPGTVVGPRDVAVVVRKSDGSAVATGTTVTFTCSGNCALSNPAATTNASGVAATRWQLPTTTGAATVTATAGVAGSVNFTAAVGGAVLASTITKVAGDAQTALAGRAVAVAPAVTVRDAGGNPLAGAVITFTPNGNGRVSNHVVITDANGLASTTWQLPTTIGLTPQLDATANGGVIVVSFTATATPIPATLTKVSDTRCVGDFTCAPNGYAGPQAPTIKLTDNMGVALGTTTGVVFSATGGTLSNANPTTDAGGFAATEWRFPATPGTYTLTASVPAFPNVAAVTFTASVGVAAGATIEVVAGDNQTVTAGQLARPSSPYVRVKDALGFAAVGAIVTFTPSGNGQVSNPVVTTNAQGLASTEWLLPTFAPFTMQACISGTATCVVFTAVSAGLPVGMGIVAGNGQTGAVGAVIGPRDPALVVSDESGNPLQNITVVFTPSGNGVVSNPSALTDVNGVAATVWQLGTTLGPQTLTATITITGGGTLTRTFTATATP